jgi:phosphoglycerate dehydrogenase-like enzyme
MADAAFFGAMKPNSVLVNIGRGGLVDETALVAGLAADKPRLAILDVFREEPLPRDNPLWDHPKVRVSAHASSFGSGTLTRGDQLFLDNLARYLKGGALINEVSASSF